jgi:hypothetical protein
MRIYLLSLCFYALLAHAAFAETFQLPEQKPVVSFSLPESWKPTETDTGLEAGSVGEYVDADSVKDLIDALPLLV